MRAPDYTVYVVFCHYTDGSGDPSVLGVFENDTDAERLRDAVNAAEPLKTVEILESYFWGNKP